MNPARNAPCCHRLQGVGELCGIVGIRILATPADPVLFPALGHPGLYDRCLRGCTAVHLVDCVEKCAKFDFEGTNRIDLEEPRNLDSDREDSAAALDDYLYRCCPLTPARGFHDAFRPVRYL